MMTWGAAVFTCNPEDFANIRIIHRRKRWTKERRAKLVTYAACGLGRAEIASKLGITPHAVSCEMYRLGLTIKVLRESALAW